MIALLTWLACARVPDDPPSLEMDRYACTSCRMMVSDPNFAVMLYTPDGERRTYDDPACAFRDIVATHPAIARMWFRDSTSAKEAWIPWSAVGFVEATGAPMDGGLAAVPAGTPGAVSFGEASARIVAKNGGTQ